MTQELTPLAKRILQIVRENPDGVTRQQVGEQLNRPNGRVNPYDVDLLEKLVEAGLLTAFDRPIGTVKTERVYTAGN